MTANNNGQDQRDEYMKEMEGGALLSDLDKCRARAAQIYNGYEALPVELQVQVQNSMAAMEQAIKDKKSMGEILAFAEKALGFIKVLI